MAAALQVADQMIVGDELVIAGTGFANSTAYTAQITLPGPDAPSITLKGTTTSGGALAGSDEATIIPSSPGVCSISVSDGTSTVAASIEIFRSV
jgi:hypothetical protein